MILPNDCFEKSKAITKFSSGCLKGNRKGASFLTNGAENPEVVTIIRPAGVTTVRPYIAVLASNGAETLKLPAPVNDAVTAP